MLIRRTRQNTAFPPVFGRHMAPDKAQWQFRHTQDWIIKTHCRHKEDWTGWSEVVNASSLSVRKAYKHAMSKSRKDESFNEARKVTWTAVNRRFCECWPVECYNFSLFLDSRKWSSSWSEARLMRHTSSWEEQCKHLHDLPFLHERWLVVGLLFVAWIREDKDLGNEQPNGDGQRDRKHLEAKLQACTYMQSNTQRCCTGRSNNGERKLKGLSPAIGSLLLMKADRKHLENKNQTLTHWNTARLTGIPEKFRQVKRR